MFSLTVGCAHTDQLSESVLEKLDAPLQQLITSPETKEDQQCVVLVHTTALDDLRAEGVTVSSSVGGIAITRITIRQLKRIAELPSVTAIESNNRRTPHWP